MALMTLQHPFHEHALTRRDLSGRRFFRCKICSQDVRSAAYACKECSYTLHEACASVEIPLQIANHPIHPDHPLVLKGTMYSCDLCDISHDLSLAIATPMPLGEEGNIPEVHHEHALTAFLIKLPNWINCRLCRQPIRGPSYGCQTCYKFYHERCARLPAEIRQHPLHSQHPQSPLILTFLREGECDFCGDQEFECLAYYCEECDIHIHAVCATLLLPPQDQKKEDRVGMHHLCHEHELLSGHVQEIEDGKLCCAACDLEISGEVYYCLDCIFFLHKLCADELPHDMVHYLHPEHHLILLPNPPPDRVGPFWCNCCRSIFSGMAFRCAGCDFNLDPKCALQTSSAIRDGVPTKIQYFDHDHPLVLGYSWSYREISCEVCQLYISGLAYSCQACYYDVHRSCAEVPLQLEHPYHSHPLNLVRLENFCCYCCRSETEGLTFRCPLCDFDLCFLCAIEMPTLKHQLHEHTLGYFENIPEEGTVLCNSCGKVDSFDFYCCRRCNFNLHGSCVSLPPTIQHECHPYHPLVLFDRFVEGLPEYQYCDYCEELRNPDHGVYRCAREECWYTVHIGCVLPQATQHEKLYLDKLTNEIASLGETIEVKEKDLVALKQKREELEQERREILSKHGEEV